MASKESFYSIVFPFVSSFSDVAVRKKRKKHGGSGRKLFTEGWIEFKDKRAAKAVALSLNNTTIGNDINWFATDCRKCPVTSVFSRKLFFSKLSDHI